MQALRRTACGERKPVGLERLAEESAERTRKIASRLAKAGLSRRDVGELLGVSFQRVQQLLK